MPHSRAFRIWLVTTLGGALISGVLWLVLDVWGWREGEFGLVPHPWLQSVRVAHGIFSAGALVAYGMLLSAHVPAGWRGERRRASGALLVAALGLLGATGLVLYYGGMEEMRIVAKWTHNAAGLAFPLLLGVHLMERRRCITERQPGTTAPR
jgi:hypothetical protein